MDAAAVAELNMRFRRALAALTIVGGLMSPAFVPSTAAPTHLGRFRAAPLTASGPGAGGPVLTDVFGPARQLIQVAFGADLTANPDGWPWVDVTTLVQWNPGVTISPMGRSDESTVGQPAGMRLVLNNTSDDFTIGNAFSQYWPNVKENTPIRAQLDLGDGPVTRFFGYVNGFTPRWDSSRNAAFVDVSASGVRRRLKQGQSPARSPIRRFIEKSATAPMAYWPLEDASGSPSAASAVAGVGPMVPEGTTDSSGVRYATDRGRVQPASTGFEIMEIGTDALASFRDGVQLVGTIPPRTDVCNGYTVNFIGRTSVFTGAPGSDVTLFYWRTPGATFVHWNVIQRSATGDTDVVAYDDNNNPTTMATVTGIGVPIDLHSYRINVSYSGGNITTVLRITRTTSAFEAGGLGFTINAGTVAWPTYVAANPYQAVVAADSISVSGNLINDIIVGHVVIWPVPTGGPVLTAVSTDPDTGKLVSAWGGYVGESARARLRRLCDQEHVTLEIIGSTVEPLGIQPSGTFLDLLDQTERADGGLLFDGLNAGFTYATRSSAYALPATLTLDASLSQFDPLVPRHDDQGRVNDFTARQPAGTSAQYVKTDGVLGVTDVGRYDSGDDVNLYSVDDLYQYAAWRVNLGTGGGSRELRYPSLSMNLAKPSTSLVAAAWLAMRPMQRLDAVNMQGSIPSLSLLLRGWSERWNSKLWEVIANLTPYEPWRVLVLAQDSGDTGEFLGWLDTDGSTLTAGVAAGATSLSVATTSGPIWSTAADDCPQVVEVAGIPVTVTAIAGASSPQMFTVDGATVTKALPAGSAVAVWHPVLLGR